MHLIPLTISRDDNLPAHLLMGRFWGLLNRQGQVIGTNYNFYLKKTFGLRLGMVLRFKRNPQFLLKYPLPCISVPICLSIYKKYEKFLIQLGRLVPFISSSINYTNKLTSTVWLYLFEGAQYLLLDLKLQLRSIDCLLVVVFCILQINIRKAPLIQVPSWLKPNEYHYMNLDK